MPKKSEHLFFIGSDLMFTFAKFPSEEQSGQKAPALKSKDRKQRLT